MLRDQNSRVHFIKREDEKICLLNDRTTFSIVLLTNVKSRVHLNFKSVSLGESTIVFLFPGETLTSKAKVFEHKAVEFQSNCIKTTENLMYLLFNNEIRVSDESRSVHKLKKSNGVRIKDYFNDIERLFANEDAEEDQVFSVVNNLVYECVYTRLFDSHQEVINFVDLLNSNFDKNHLVSDYAEVQKIPPKELLRAFQKRDFDKPSSIIKERLLIESKKLLISTSMDVKQIGQQLGFEDPAYFARFFKRNTGKTASQFREHYLKS